MLNSYLIEHLGSVHRQGKSGVLTVLGPGYRLRFCIENGDPTALDLGADKEMVLLDEMRTRHQLDDAGYAALAEQYQKGTGAIADLAPMGNLASADEVAAATRGMVESTLMRCFGGMHYDLSFADGAGDDSFDFDRSAVRLRIAMPQLLSTAQQRVQENDRIAAAVPANAIHALDESTGSQELSSFERHLLDYVDGHTTVATLARTCRCSVAEMARSIDGLVSKGVLKQIRLDIVQPVSAQPAPVPTSPANLPMSVPVVVHGPNWALRAGLTAALVITGVVGYGIMEATSQRRMQEQIRDALDQSISARAWNDAVQQVDQLMAAAGNDLSALTMARKLRQHLDEALQKERATLIALAEKGEAADITDRLAKLPRDASFTELSQKIKQVDDVFRERLASIQDRIARTLDGGRAAEALALVKGSEPAFQPMLLRDIAHWRESQLDLAALVATPYGQRCRIVSQAAVVEPTPLETTRITELRGILARERTRLAGILSQLQVRAEAGAFVEVDAVWAKERMGEQLLGSDLAEVGDRAHATYEQARRELVGLQEKAARLVVDGQSFEDLHAHVQAITQALTTRTAASNGDVLRAYAGALAEITSVVQRAETLANEVRILRQIAETYATTTEVAAAVRARVTRLDAGEQTATEALERARAFIRQNDLEGAQRILDDFNTRDDWRRTDARLVAQQEQVNLHALVRQRQVWQQELEQAMGKGDAEQALVVAKRMGLKYLPLRIESIPVGAEVWRDGQRLGVTPLTLDLSSAERSGMNFELRQTGFAPATVSAAAATAGWRLMTRLEREPAFHLDLGQPLTLRPAVVEGRVWLGNRQRLIGIASDHTTETIQLDGGSDLAEPIYTPVSAMLGALWLPTGDNLVLRLPLDHSPIQRIPFVVRTDYPVQVYASSYVTGRQMIVAAGRDGVLRGVECHTPSLGWSGPAGAPFVGSPQRAGDDLLLVARRDGHLEAYHPDDGSLAASQDLQVPAAASWSDHGTLCVLAGGWQWRWNGSGAPKREEIPALPANGGEGVFITLDNHVFLHAATGWNDLGKIDGTPTSSPVRWGDHAAIAVGHRLVVLGPVAFTVTAADDVLEPVVQGDALVMTTMAGVVNVYNKP
jgi:hypothetical protein